MPGAPGGTAAQRKNGKAELVAGLERGVRPAVPAQAVRAVAFEVPDKRSFALAYRALFEAGIPVVAVDHYISWAMYFDDPDGNGLEIYWDTRTQPGGRQLWHGDNAPIENEAILAALAE